MDRRYQCLTRGIYGVRIIYAETRTAVPWTSDVTRSSSQNFFCCSIRCGQELFENKHHCQVWPGMTEIATKMTFAASTDVRKERTVGIDYGRCLERLRAAVLPHVDYLDDVWQGKVEEDYPPEDEESCGFFEEKFVDPLLLECWGRVGRDVNSTQSVSCDRLRSPHFLQHNILS